jgi:hypothetical protein
LTRWQRIWQTQAQKQRTNKLTLELGRDNLGFWAFFQDGLG